MQFEQATALQIIEKYKLAPQTLRTWEHRQRIPDKYFEPGFAVREKLSHEQDLQAQKHVLRALQTNKFNLQSLSRLAGLPKFVLADFKKGSISLAAQELIAVKRAINTIRNEAKAILAASEKLNYPEQQKRLLAQFIKRKEIHFTVLMDRQKQAYDAFYSWANGKSQSLPGAQPFTILKSCLLIFITETTI
jgi:peroxiredoxin